MTIPPDLLLALSRRHKGRQLPHDDIMQAHLQMQVLYHKYLSTQKKLDYLLEVEWEEKRIEEHYEDSIWYNHHRRLRKYEKELKELHKNMFYVLLSCDGNYEPFDFGSLTVNEIIGDFYRKYKLIFD